MKMQCNTVRPGVSCEFMSAAGCNFDIGTCHQIVEDCEGCTHVQEQKSGKFCEVYPEPAAQWEGGICPVASHRRYVPSSSEVISTNPLKASKRAAGGRRR